MTPEEELVHRLRLAQRKQLMPFKPRRPDPDPLPWETWKAKHDPNLDPEGNPVGGPQPAPRFQDDIGKTAFKASLGWNLGQEVGCWIQTATLLIVIGLGFLLFLAVCFSH
jgi:hypothetical protein